MDEQSLVVTCSGMRVSNLEAMVPLAWVDRRVMSHPPPD